MTPPNNTYRLATDEEVRREYPRVEPFIAATVCVTDDDDSPYVDCYMILYEDGAISVPNAELKFDELRGMVKLLEQKYEEFTAQRASSGAPPAPPAPA